ncbi:MAG: metallophosphoesterase, partial [Halanaerobiaceae bacterium]
MEKPSGTTIVVKLILFIIFFTTFLIYSNHPVNIEAGENTEKDYINFTILHTNDEHSALLPQASLLDYGQGAEDSSIGGAARLAGAIKSIKMEKEKQEEPVLTVSAGDFLGGTPFSWLNYRELAPELNILQKIEYDLITIGNHDF